MTAADVVARLESARRTGIGRWIARCPSHEDRSPSLSIRELDDGRTLLHCFGGCHVDEVLNSVGMSVADLFPERPTNEDRRQPRSGIHPTDALACMAHEGRVLLIAGRDMACGEVLLEADLERVSLAVRRIGAAVEVAHA